MNIVLLMFALPVLAQSGGTVTVSGVVTSAEDKYPLIGAHVIAGDNNGVSTLLDGSYSIDVKPGDVLTYYYVGYEEVKYTVPDGAASIKHNVELKAETKSLEDVVVIAYGVRKKGTIAGSVSTVKAEKIENTPTAAFDQALQGQVPGLTVLSSSGEPSVAATLSIRGTNSINSGTAPLYILDGAAISSADFNTINPADIESISVRTDASSRFGADRRWAGFWSVSFMWNLRQERFMDNASRWLTNAQIAVSTGTSGNSSIPNYEHLALVSGGSDYFGNAGIAPSQPGSDNLGWEKLWATNLAFHLGFWNRLNVDLEFYNKRTSDMLMLVPESYANKGYGYSWDNIGVMVNRGFELNVTVTIFSNRNFMWSVNANVSYNRNRILELYNGVQEYEMSQTAIEGEDGAYQIMVNGLFTEENIDGGVGIIDFYDANIDNTEDPGNNAHNRYCVTMPAFRDLVKHDANNAVFAFNAEGQYSSTTAGTEVVDDYATAGVSSTAGLKFFVLTPDGYGGYYAAKEKTGWVTVTDDMWDETGEIFQHRDYTIAVTANSGAARSAVLVALPHTLAAEIDENGDLDAQLLKADGSYDLKDEYKPYVFATVEQDAPASGSGDEGLSVVCPTDATTQYYLDNGFFKFEELTEGDPNTDEDVAEFMGEIESGAKLYRLTYNNQSMSEGSLQLQIKGEYNMVMTYPYGNEWLVFYDASSGMVDAGSCVIGMSGADFASGEAGSKGSIALYDSNWQIVARIVCIRNY